MSAHNDAFHFLPGVSLREDSDSLASQTPDPAQLVSLLCLVFVIYA